jgi:hypothetical protein
MAEKRMDDFVETKQASVSRMERAETVPLLTLLKKLAAALDTRGEIHLVPRN